MDIIGRDDGNVALYPNWKVNKVIHNNQWHLIVPSLAQIWHMIAKTCIHAQERDFWKWTGNASGRFSFKSSWEAPRLESQKFELHPIIWYHAHCPKMSSCLLRALQDKLLTMD